MFQLFFVPGVRSAATTFFVANNSGGNATPLDSGVRMVVVERLREKKKDEPACIDRNRKP